MKPAPKDPSFSRIREAREALQRKAERWAQDYANLIEQAVKKGDIEFGTKAIQWAFEHMLDEDGGRVVAGSVDKVREPDKLSSGPTIQIGFALGGLPQQPALKVIDVTAEAPADRRQLPDRTDVPTEAMAETNQCQLSSDGEEPQAPEGNRGLSVPEVLPLRAEAAEWLSSTPSMAETATTPKVSVSRSRTPKAKKKSSTTPTPSS